MVRIVQKVMIKYDAGSENADDDERKRNGYAEYELDG